MVSILILLEVILEVVGNNPTHQGVPSFNPYFTGSNSGSFHYFSFFSSFSSFNPYFTGSNSGRSVDWIAGITHIPFQSLFYWK